MFSVAPLICILECDGSDGVHFSLMEKPTNKQQQQRTQPSSSATVYALPLFEEKNHNLKCQVISFVLNSNNGSQGCCFFFNSIFELGLTVFLQIYFAGCVSCVINSELYFFSVPVCCCFLAMLSSLTWSAEVDNTAWLDGCSVFKENKKRTSLFVAAAFMGVHRVKGRSSLSLSPQQRPEWQMRNEQHLILFSPTLFKGCFHFAVFHHNREVL